MHPGNDVYVPWIERRLPECDVRLGTTRFLQDKFGCRIFHVGVDADRFKPQDPAAVAALKRELGLQDRKLLVFGGVARPHKGLEAYAAALARLGQPHAAILILGPMDDYVRDLMRHPEYGKHVLCPATDADATRRIHRDMPLYLGLGDVLIVPLSDGPMARSQMPCKVFEAMAMGKPIVASAVSDLPEVLAGCGKLVEPGRSEAVAQALSELFADPAGARVMGERARARCLEKFGAESSRQALLALLDELK